MEKILHRDEKTMHRDGKNSAFTAIFHHIAMHS